MATKATPSRVKSDTRAEYNTGAPADRTESDDALIARAIAVFDRRDARDRGPSFSDPDKAGEYLRLRLHGLEREHFDVLLLDTRHRLIHAETLFMGSLDGAEVQPREVAKLSLAHNAAAVIFGHNHPSGNPEPSAADRSVTARLKQALALIDVRVLDHFVIGDGMPTSMARRGWL